MLYVLLFVCWNWLVENFNVLFKCIELNNDGFMILKSFVLNLKVILRFKLMCCEFCELVKIVIIISNVDIVVGYINFKWWCFDYDWIEYM